MEPEARYAFVGTAVLVLLALLAAAVVWLRSTGEGANARQYKILFERHSLEGLEPRSYVTMRGIRIGSVTAFRFSEEMPGAIEVMIAVDPGAPVRESTRATVERHLVTGIASVRLENSTEDSPLLRKPPPGEEYPVIAEGESTFEQVSETLNHLVVRADDTLAQANETMRRIDDVLSPANRAAFAEMLRNLGELARQAQGTLARTNAALASIGEAADRVRALADETSGLARSVATDAQGLAARYDALGTQAIESIEELRAAVRSIAADAERVSRRADVLLDSGGEELRATAQSLRSAADAVSAAAVRLRDPGRVFFGPAEGALGPGEGR